MAKIKIATRRLKAEMQTDVMRPAKEKAPGGYSGVI